MAPPSRSGSHPGRALAALAVLVLVMFFTITAGQTFNPGNWQSRFKVGLGLDLSSGTEVVLQAATQKGAPSPAAMQQAISVLEARVNGTGNSGAQVQQIGSDLLAVTVPGKAASAVINLVSTTAKMAFRPVYLEQAYQAPTPATTPSASPSAKASGSATPTGTSTKSSATTKPTSSTSASAGKSASPKASAQAKGAALASPTATPAATAKASSTPSTTATPKASATPTPTSTSTSAASAANGDPSLVNAATMKLFNKLVCTPGPNATTVNDNWKQSVGYTDAADQWDTNSQIVSCDPSGNKYVLGPIIFEGTQLTSVQAGLQPNSTQWIVNLTLDSAATSAFGKVTTNQATNYLPNAATNPNDAVLAQNAIVLDGDVQEAPETQSALTSGTFMIQGPQPQGFTQAQANQLTNVLKYGQLPLNFTQQSVNSISASQGRSSLEAGLIAGILGLVLVVIYLFYYYRGLGIVSVSSLLLAALLAYLSVVLLTWYQNFTMSLSAIAGLVVAIGITADSFIVYFERLRDEVREGKTLRPAVEAGWKRARRTILVSDTVSFIAALLLYHFAVSDVQGFAYTLGLTTVIDVVVVFLFTKPMVTILAGTKFFSSGHKWSGLDPERLGAKTRWRSSTRRTVRTQRTSAGRSVGDSSGSSSTSREA
ncbi:MAG TPA: protein translocase subunit SecD [Trebonia sp.]|nr:protein translocase subunit SecD [Trebonia sp.]